MSSNIQYNKKKGGNNSLLIIFLIFFSILHSRTSENLVCVLLSKKAKGKTICFQFHFPCSYPCASDFTTICQVWSDLCPVVTGEETMREAVITGAALGGL